MLCSGRHQFFDFVDRQWSAWNLITFPNCRETNRSKIFDAMYRDETCTSTTAADGTVTRNACPDAYGKLLGLYSLQSAIVSY